MSLAAERALEVLELLAGEESALPVRVIAERLGIPRASAYRLVRVLVERGYLEADEGRYRLGLKLVTLGGVVADRLDIREAARGPMQELLGLSRETVELVIYDRGEMVFIDKMESPQSMRIFARVGTRSSNLHVSAPGKVILAFLSDRERKRYLQRKLVRVTEKTKTDPSVLERELEGIRAKGWAFDDQEVRIGVRRFAAPVLDHEGNFVAAVGIAGPAVRLELSRKREFAAMVTGAGRKMTENLGGKYPW